MEPATAGVCRAIWALLAPFAEDITLPVEPSWSRGVYHLYVVRHPQRDALQAHLGAKGIGTGIHYPIPLHLQKAYKGLGYSQGDFPVAEKPPRKSCPCRCTPSCRRISNRRLRKRSRNLWASRARS